jgi:signal transduction histidine kinase
MALAEEEIASITAANLMVVGEYDPMSPLDEAVELFEGLRCPKEFWLMENDAHTPFLYPHLGGYPAFNAMAESLERNEQARRNLLADVAHELRTPLTIIEGTADGIMDGVLEPTAQQLGIIREEAELLTRLVGDLRDLSLAEAGQLHLDRAPHDRAQEREPRQASGGAVPRSQEQRGERVGEESRRGGPRGLDRPEERHVFGGSARLPGRHP